ncbi:hypothetical protein I3843_12G047900 [Carya illinoinensis]|uniref:Uncharacterized protein n=1 Tax=Carya illinoinensis TaxID=32201 RepID=A0A8T1NWY0_CARIL|nr:uncharacterized protein LOC122289128 isoform X2 [Carya illinoinensis]KAG6633443.1 hypothetical protein CIPAW_12G048400 [Carya illinoinensis]KAG7952211.1 hypothetical protein I3843_12G047900 [Carya illinoinensis]
MDNSNPELASDSQVPGSSCSLSFPSEPPDIRLWFSSYKYESPVMDSNDNFGDSLSKESEFAKDKLVMEESNGDKEENPGRYSCIRKRSEGLVCGKLCSSGYVKCCSSSGNDKHETQFSNRMFLDIPSAPLLADSLHSPSLLSEPPDIRNWFSSYVYESPVLNTSEDLGDFISIESGSKNVGSAIEESNSEKKEILREYKNSRNRGDATVGEMLHSDGDVKSHWSVNNEHKPKSLKEVDIGVGWNKTTSALNNSSFGSSLGQSLNVEILQNDRFSPTKDVSSLNCEDSKSKQEQPQKTTSMLLNISRTSGSDDRETPNKLISIRDSTREISQVEVQAELGHGSPESNSKLNLLNGITMKKSTQEISGKENEEKDVSEIGFVTTRNINFKRTNNEDSMRRPEGINKRTDSTSCGKKGLIKTKVLAETTNFQRSGAIEVTGKWQCPQKSKPDKGPPLKQLRLEQWIRRA